MKYQEYSHLNKTYIIKTQLDMPKWMEEVSTGLIPR